MDVDAGGACVVLGLCGSGECVALEATPVGALWKAAIGEVYGALVGALALEGALCVGAAGVLSQGTLEGEVVLLAAMEFVLKGVKLGASKRAVLTGGVLIAPTSQRSMRRGGPAQEDELDGAFGGFFVFVGVFGRLPVVDAADHVVRVEVNAPHRTDVNGQQALEGVVGGAAHHKQRGVFDGLAFDDIARCIGRNDGHLIGGSDVEVRCGRGCDIGRVGGKGVFGRVGGKGVFGRRSRRLRRGGGKGGVDPCFDACGAERSDGRKGGRRGGAAGGLGV